MTRQVYQLWTTAAIGRILCQERPYVPFPRFEVDRANLPKIRYPRRKGFFPRRTTGDHTTYGLRRKMHTAARCCHDNAKLLAKPSSVQTLRPSLFIVETEVAINAQTVQNANAMLQATRLAYCIEIEPVRTSMILPKQYQIIPSKPTIVSQTVAPSGIPDATSRSCNFHVKPPRLLDIRRTRTQERKGAKVL